MFVGSLFLLLILHFYFPTKNGDDDLMSQPTAQKNDTFKHLIQMCFSDHLIPVMPKKFEFFNISEGPHIAIKGLLNLP